MTPTNEIIKLLKNDADGWAQGKYTLANKKRGIEIWTINAPYFGCGIHRPIRKTRLMERVRLQIAVNMWHRRNLTAPQTD